MKTKPRTLYPTALFLGLAAALCLVPLPAAGAAQIDPEEPISMDLENASGVEVLRSFALVLGVGIDLDPAVTGAVTLSLEAVRPFAALDQVCDQLDCVWELVEGEETVLRVRSTASPEQAPLSLALLDADLQQVLTSMGQVLGASELYIDPELTGAVGLELSNVPWSSAMDALCASAGCVWELSVGETFRALHVKATADARPGRSLGTVRLSAEDLESRQETARRGVHRPAEVDVSFRAPGDQRLQGRARFDLQRSRWLGRLGSGNQGWEVLLNWVPVGRGRGMLIPIVQRCGVSEAQSTAYLQAFRLPLDTAESIAELGAVLELAPVYEGVADEASAAGAGEGAGLRPSQARSCASWGKVTVEAWADGARYLQAFSGPGDVTTLLLPSSDREASEAGPLTLVALGRTSAGGLELGVLVPDATTRETEIHRLTLEPGQSTPWKARLADGETMDLELRLAE